MSEKSKRFMCEQDCGMKEMEITVEPSYDITPENEEWLNDISICPVCGSALTEV